MWRVCKEGGRRRGKARMERWMEGVRGLMDDCEYGVSVALVIDEENLL